MSLRQNPALGTRLRAATARDERALLVSSVRQHELAEQAQKAEAALAESEEQLRRAIEESPIPVIIHAEDGEVLRISRSWTGSHRVHH